MKLVNRNSNIYSFILSLLMIINNIYNNNIESYVYISSILNIIKSLNIFKCNKIELLHHIITILLCLLCLYNNNITIILYEDFKLIHEQNISTLFLTLRNLYKNIYFDYLFAITFFYYRIKFNYNLYIGNINDGINEICYYNKNCFNFFYISLFLLSLLNNYWFYLLSKKIFIKKFL
jgi:hypothetical protein